jgi:hypothetical protein
MTLLDRLSQLQGPDREVDELIRVHVGADKVSHGTASGLMLVDEDYEARCYTQSIDDALTLVPQGWIWDVSSSGCAWVMPPDDLEGQIVVGGKDQPAIALTIAALRARGM